MPVENDGGRQWLECVMEAGKSKIQRTQTMHKAPEMFRRIEANRDYFDPLVVSIGPYHHGKPELKLMEEYKVKMVRSQFNGDKGIAEAVYEKIKKVAGEARNCYAEGSTEEFDDEKFTRMMFLDGCFILQFIHCTVNRREDLNMKNNTEACARRDLFLLENQLPYQVLKELMSFDREEEEWKKTFRDFVHQICGLPPKYSPEETVSKKAVDNDQTILLELEPEPAHLLEFVRTQLIDQRALTIGQRISSVDVWSSYRSATQLKATGIHFGMSKSGQFTDVQFKSTFLKQVLTLPPIAIDDNTKSFLLNMAAYEACPDGPEDAGVSSYICFMDSLIDDVEDVKELRSKGILLNYLGNDQQVADLFNRIGSNLVPNPYAYAGVKNRVEKHYNNSMKVWLSKWLHKNFPFTAFFAGASALCLSAIQTYFTVYSTYNSNKK